MPNNLDFSGTQNLLGGISGQGTQYGSGPWTATLGCRDWQTWQWKASYKNIPFAVAADSRFGGRRCHVHEYPGREYWDNEDLGRLRQMVEAQCYVFGDQSDLWSELLFARCTDRTVGTLFLPERVPIEAICLQIESMWTEQANGRFDFNLRFTLEPTGLEKGLLPTTGFISSTLLAGRVGIAARRVMADSRASFEKEFTGPQPSVGRAQAAEMMKSVAYRLKKAAAQARIISSSASKIDFNSKHIGRLASELADSQRTLPKVLTPTMSVFAQRPTRFSRLSASVAGLKPITTGGVSLRSSTGQVIPALGKSNEGFGGILEDSLKTMAEGSPDPLDLVLALFSISNLKPIMANPTSLSASTSSENLLSKAVAGFARRMSLAQQCLAAVRVSPLRMPEAVTIRKRLLRNIQMEMEQSVDNSGICQCLTTLQSKITEYYSFCAANGSLTQRISVPTSKPLAAVAANIYGPNKFAGKDREIMKLNGLRHPLFGVNDMAVPK